MTYLVIEHFHPGKVKEIYRRLEQHGRMLPEGVHYLDSWIDEPVTTCYQLMESDSREALEDWIEHWRDLADFTVIPVIGSVEAKARVLG